MFHIVLISPEIPQNTGNIARTCAAAGCDLHLVKPLGFELSDKYCKRAALDYWKDVTVKVHETFESVQRELPSSRFYFFTTKAKKVYTEAEYRPGDALVFGRETKGIDEELLICHPLDCVRIPMIGKTRSLNLSNAAAIAVYEGFRQNGFSGLTLQGELHRLKW